VLRYAAAVFICSVLMVLAFPLSAFAKEKKAVSENESSLVSSDVSSDSSAAAEKPGGDWKIFLSIGAGIAVVAVVIGVIASKDA